MRLGVALCLLAASASAQQVRGRISSPPPQVTSPATGPGYDTCTGGGCGIGPGGFATDSGVVIRGLVNRNTIGNGGGNFNLYNLVQLTPAFSLTAGDSTFNQLAQCMGADISSDGGLLCVFSTTASNTPTADLVTFGSTATSIAGAGLWADGGNLAPSTFVFAVDERINQPGGEGRSRSIQLTSAKAANLSILVDGMDAGVLGAMEPVAIMRGNFSGTPIIEVGTTTLVGGTKAITFNTGYSAAPTCRCNDTSGGVAGAPVACSTDVPIAASFNIYGVGTDTVSWWCVGPR